MPSDAPPADQFWLLTGPVPSGPFTVGEIHAKLAAGDASWQTPACPVGAAQWLPLVQTPGIGPSAGAAEQPAEPAVPAPVEPASVPSVPSLPADMGAGGAQPQSAGPPRNDAAPRSSKQVAEAVGGIAALALVGGLIWGAKCAEEAIRGPKAPAVPAVSQAKIDPSVVARFANKEAFGTAGVPQAPNVPPPDRALDPARRLVGSWRWTAPNGYASTFSFEAGGSFTYYVTGSNPLANLPAAAAGEAVGRWSVRDGTLFLEFTGGTTPATDTLFRGSTGRSPVRFVSDSTVQLSGVEGDAVTRTYTRVR
jgi:hypothetical protein